MKPVDVNPSMYVDFNKKNDVKDPKFTISDIVRISKSREIFAKCHVPNLSEVFMIKKVKNIVSWIYVPSDLEHEETVGTFYIKELKKQIKKSLELKNLLKEKVRNLMSKENTTIIALTVGLIKKAV